MIIEKSILLSVSKEDIPENGKFVVPDGVTEIGEAVFFECKLLKEIYFPKSLISIRDHTFYNCKFLEKIHICDGLISIGNFAFCGCESLREINLPESVQKISEGTFWYCKSLKEIYLPQKITSIAVDVFRECESLEEIHLPKNLERIDHFAFFRCTSLKEVRIPENVTSVSVCAFKHCQNLHFIQWGENYYTVRCIDGYCMHIKNQKYLRDIKILRCSYFPNKGIVYVAEKDEYTAHGKTVREAVEDLLFKILQAQDMTVHIQRIVAQGYMDANDYRLITGACREGTNHFLEVHNLTWDDKMSVQDVLKLVEGEYGFERFREVADQILELT